MMGFWLGFYCGGALAIGAMLAIQIATKPRGLPLAEAITFVLLTVAWPWTIYDAMARHLRVRK